LLGESSEREIETELAKNNWIEAHESWPEESLKMAVAVGLKMCDGWERISSSLEGGLLA